MSTRQTLSDLARRLERLPGFCPEHIVSANRGTHDGSVLIDAWGRIHPLPGRCTLGRDAPQVTVALLHSSVSRVHAELQRQPDGSWRVRDRGSTNGTFVDGERIAGEAPIGDRQTLSVGDVELVLVCDRASLGEAPADGLQITHSTAPPPAPFCLIPSESGAGVVACGALSVSLPSTQFALLALLAERYEAEREQPPPVRGFVRTVELLSRLPWDTAHPDDNHVKQVVRRVRRALEKAGIDDPIDSRHGFGYRLSIEPATYR